MYRMALERMGVSGDALDVEVAAAAELSEAVRCGFDALAEETAGDVSASCFSSDDFACVRRDSAAL